MALLNRNMIFLPESFAALTLALSLAGWFHTPEEKPISLISWFLRSQL